MLTKKQIKKDFKNDCRLYTSTKIYYSWEEWCKDNNLCDECGNEWEYCNCPNDKYITKRIKSKLWG